MKHTGFLVDQVLLSKEVDERSSHCIGAQLTQCGTLLVTQETEGQESFYTFDHRRYYLTLEIESAYLPQLACLMGVEPAYLLVGLRSNFNDVDALCALADFCDRHMIPFTFKAQASLPDRTSF